MSSLRTPVPRAGTGGSSSIQGSSITTPRYAGGIGSTASVSSVTPSLLGVNNQNDRRHLIRPSNLVPWSVDVVSAVPKKVVECSQLNSYATGAVCHSTCTSGGWTCLGLDNGQFHLWQNKNNGGNISSKSNDHHSFLLDPPKHVLTLYYPQPQIANSTTTENPPPLVALASSPENESVFCYVAYPVSGLLVLWKVSRKDLMQPANATAAMGSTNDNDTSSDPYDQPMTSKTQQQRRGGSRPCTAKVYVELDHDAGEHLTSLTVEGRHTIVVGTSLGRVHWCTQTTVPIVLHVQRAEPVNQSSTLLSYLWSTSNNAYQPNDDHSPIMCQLFFNSLNFLSISQNGTLLVWKVLPSNNASSHHRAFQAHQAMSLGESLQQRENIRTQQEVEVIYVDANASKDKLHILLRTTSTNNDNSFSMEAAESRLYWVRIKRNSTDESTSFEWIDAHWLNRFAAPRDVSVIGLVITDNAVAYAAFHLRSGGQLSTVIVMALPDSTTEDSNLESATEAAATVIHEVDLPYKQIPALVPNTLAKDVVTHGCTVFATSGLGIRIRLITGEADQHHRRQKSKQGLSMKLTSNSTSIHTLTSHLLSTFWESYKHPNATIRIPPSLNTANPQDLERAIVAVASQLQHNTGGESSSLILLEWHHSLIQLLQQGGLYRSLSIYCKWQLLALGQEAAVFLDLAQAPPSSPRKRRRNQWEQEHLQDLRSHDVALWLKSVFQDTLKQLGASGDVTSPSPYDTNVDADTAYDVWCSWLCSALQVAMAYRQERASFMYDVSPEQTPAAIDDEPSENSPCVVPVWTSHPILQEVLHRQLEYWKNNIQMTDPTTVQIVVEVALQSFADTAHSFPTDASQRQYHDVKSISIPLLRAVVEDGTNDSLAFSLSVKHQYFEGLCQLALDHEKKADREYFRLDPLFTSFTTSTFGNFVLSWHCDRKLYGHAIKYGRNCPDVLNDWLKHDERLRPYQWIQSSHCGDYESAAESLFSNANSGDSDLSDVKWSLCMAKLSNHILLGEQQATKSFSTQNTSKMTPAEDRHLRIENKLELIKAQEMLFQHDHHLNSPSATPMETTDGKQSVLCSRDKLLSLALSKADQVKNTKEDIIKYCLIALAITATYDDHNGVDAVKRKQSIAQVWAKSILSDSTLWNDFIHSNSSSTDPHQLNQFIINETVFGALLQECRQNSRLSKVVYGSHIEDEVLQRLTLLVSDSFKSPMRQILDRVVSCAMQQ